MVIYTYSSAADAAWHGGSVRNFACTGMRAQQQGETTMKSEKKYLILKIVFLCALVVWIAFLAFFFLYVQKLPVEQMRTIVAYFDTHHSMLCAAAFLYVFPLSVAMICFGMMLKHKRSRLMAFRFALYMVAGCLFVGTLINLLLSL